MILDTSLKLVSVLAGNVAANQPAIHVDYVVWSNESKPTKPLPFRTVLNNTTDVTILAAPVTPGFVHEPLRVVIYNRDTASIDVTVKTDDGTNQRIEIRKTIPTLNSLIWEKEVGWYTTVSNAGIFTDLVVTGNTTLGDTSTDFVKVVGTLSVNGPTTALASVHVGSRAVNNSVDSQILISRVVDDTVSTNGHAFSDSSIITRSGTVAYNSYDARVDISGTSSYAHYAGFQSAPTMGTSGTVTHYYGAISLPAVSAGTVTNAHHLYASDVTGAGAVTNQYGLNVENLTKGGTLNVGVNLQVSSGATKWSIVAGTAQSAFAGKVRFGASTVPVETCDVTGTGAFSGGVKGTTTNDSATALYIGELVDAIASGVSVSTVGTNVTSISLTAGDWDVTGAIESSNSGTNSYARVGISLSSATMPSASAKDVAYQSINTSISVFSATLPRLRISLGGTSTVYLVAFMGVAPSANINGYLSARRER